MLNFIDNLFTAIGAEHTPAKVGAVGFGSVSVPGSAKFVKQLLDYASFDNSIETPLGRLNLQAMHPVPGSTARLSITGTVNSDPVTYAPLIPSNLIDFAAGREAEFGTVTLEGVLELPEITWKNESREAIVMFRQPIIVRKHTDPNARRIRRRLESLLTAKLLGIKINARQGTPILAGVANWLAPQLNWT